MKTAVYIRVSTDGQNEAGQKRELKRWLEGHGIEDVRWYVDKATGDDLDRSQFKVLQADIFAGEIKTVVVWKLDRLSRSLQDGINTLCDWLARGVRLVSVTQGFDFAGATGKLIASVLLSVAEMEQSTRRERQAAGIAAAREAGVYRGRRPGSTKVKDAAKQAAKLKARGMGESEIASLLGVSRQTVWRYLTS
jgi:DNA invertase Pin-like site-specific DNA recombinase